MDNLEDTGMNSESLSSLANSLADRVDRNVPHHGNPERFHEEKSDIVHQLRNMARQAQLHGIVTTADLLFVKGDIDHGVTMDEVKGMERA